MTTTITHALHPMTTTTTADWDSSPYTAAEEAATAAANQANLANRRINAAQWVLNAVETESPSGAYYTVPTRVLEDMADALTAPSLLDRALAGDAAAARQFLLEAGFTDEQGQLLPQYQPSEK